MAGLAYAERKYGKLGIARVMAPAIRLAREGYELSAEEAHELTDEDLAKFPDSKRIFQRDGQLYKAGEIFKQPELALTLARIATDPDDFYHGKMAQELINDLKPGGALLTLGLFTRPVAFLLSGEMAVAYFYAHAPRAFFPILNMGELAILYCFVFLYIFFAGPGPWSLDAMMKRK